MLLDDLNIEYGEFYSIIKLREDWAFSHLSRKETKELTHSYHQYPARFIPQLARELIDNYTEIGDLVWDSFCGSGSLNVEAFRTNRHTIGTDINPTAVLISRVKATPLDPSELSSYKEELLKAIHSDMVRSQVLPISQIVLSGSIDALEKWFPEQHLQELSSILWHILNTKTNRKYREFALCAFSSILKKSSYWLTSSVKSQIDPNKSPEKPLKLLERQLRSMEKANTLFYLENRDNKTQVQIFKHNAKHRLPTRIQPIDCIITSPPYLVSYDYSDIFRLSTHTLFPQRDYAQFRQAFIGTPLKRNSSRSDRNFTPYQPLIDVIGDTRIKRTLIEYYKDMTDYFINAQYHLKENGRLIMVVGDTKLRGVVIPNTYILARIAIGLGWSLEEAYRREIPVKILPTIRDVTTGRFSNRENGNSSESYDREFILILRRQKK